MGARNFYTGTASITGTSLSRLIGLTCSVAFILFGFEQGVLGGVITGPAFTKQFPSINTTSGNGSPTLQGFTLGIYNIGCWAGSLLTVMFGERLGRKSSVIVGCTILSIGTAIQCSAFTLAQLLVGRIITGTGNGIITSTIPVWHAELSRAKSRGKFIATELSTNVGGVALAYWIDYGFSYTSSPAQWRFPIALQIVFALSTIALISFLPETPRWLLSHNRREEALGILTRLHVNEPEGTANQELLEIETALFEERRAAEIAGSQGPIRLMFTNGEQRFFYRTMLGVWGMIMLQLTGINLITYYAPFIFIKSVGFSQHFSALMSGFLNLAFYVATLIPIFIIDKVGRRVLLLGGLVGMGGCMFILAGTTSVVGYSTGAAATFALFLYDFSFGVGWSPGPWLLASEYAPLTTRSQTAAFATSATWIFTFLVSQITPIAITNLAWKAYIIFGVFNCVWFPIVYFFYPETKGKTLEQIDLLFSGEKVRIDMTEEELVEAQARQIERAVKEHGVDGAGVGKGEGLGKTEVYAPDHVEESQDVEKSV